MDHDLARRPLLERGDRQQLGRDHARRLVVFFELAADEQHRVGFDQRAVLAERLRKDHDLEAAGDVVQHEDAMRSPFLVFSGRRPQTMPPTQTSASEPVSSASRLAPKVFSSSAKRSSGWPLM